MPVLRPITSRAELQAYHRFRYSIYANSVQRGFLSGPEGLDVDVYDANALHLGWYDGERLAGCVRLLRPIRATDPLHFFKDLLDEGMHRRAQALLADAQAAGRALCEVSRLCLAPEMRSLSMTRRFVLEIIAIAHRYGMDHCLFTCDAPHAPFWQRIGFHVVDGFTGYARPRSSRPGWLMRGSYAELLALHGAELRRIGLATLLPTMLAA